MEKVKLLLFKNFLHCYNETSGCKKVSPIELYNISFGMCKCMPIPLKGFDMGDMSMIMK